MEDITNLCTAGGDRVTLKRPPVEYIPYLSSRMTELNKERTKRLMYEKYVYPFSFLEQNHEGLQM